ncbi:N-acetylmuramic acid/N-acetylglucosamine kinase [Arthrobacter sp. Bi83]|uniref:N-acetylglucosamine kinase n=1 Tax=Arthrobacter sp. Bi83 TaxID=2822353 RepID=UPI001E07DCAF|nr:BadF/BadG/BcrA/BcrD ATPase family protein [Arthrobacter sp. Bi83]CAH0195145.1 N-acetylmuramic acid/N-acetylglucosamine kinase [Arthrobacter sp. Bi83]
MPRVLGLDIGGSKTHAILAGNAVNDNADDGGQAVVECTGGSANITSVGEPAASAALDGLARRLGAGNPDGHGIHTVCAGAAGADTPESRDRLAAMLSRRFPEARIQVVHDTRIILAAESLDAGTVLISGTGSAAWAQSADGREARAGGWGYLLGDEGSGYAVTRSAVRNVLTEHDAGKPPGPLSVRILKRTGAAEPLALLDLFYRNPERRYWAGLAGTVFDVAAMGDVAANAIAEDAARQLAALAVAVNERLGGLPGSDGHGSGAPGSAGPPVLLAGGMLVNQPLLAGRVRAFLEGRGLTDVRVLDRAPAWGAVKLAQELANSTGAGMPHRSNHSIHSPA